MRFSGTNHKRVREWKERVGGGWMSWLAVATMLLMVGCHRVTRPAAPSPRYSGKTSYQKLKDTPDTKHYTLETGQSAFGSDPISRPPPHYPAALVNLNLPPVSLVATVVVGTDGQVTRVVFPNVTTPMAHQQAFRHAVRCAALTWRYHPMYIESPDPQSPTGHVDEAKAFSLSYRFYFKVINGKPVVGSSARAR